MKRVGLAAAIGTAIVLAAPGASGAATVPSSVAISGFGGGDGSASANGVVGSANDACLKNRHVRIFVIIGGDKTELNDDRSSDNGFWGGDGPLEGSLSGSTFKARMSPIKLGKHKTCSGDTDEQAVSRAASHRASAYPTDLRINEAAIGPDEVHLSGKIDARTSCRKNRTVKISALTDQGRDPVDTDHASDNGYYGGGGSTSNAHGARAFAGRKKLPHGHSCKPASASEAIF